MSRKRSANSGFSNPNKFLEADRMAWGWIDDINNPFTEITLKEVETAYRLRFPIHYYPNDDCKKNCRNNPRCYSSLGAFPWLFQCHSDLDSSDMDEATEAMLDRREDGIPAGLKNLGNTCYVNSFLQIWFHNVRFRQTLYDWDPSADSEECENESILEAERYKPKGKVASLQALFAMMEFGRRSAVDPNDFIQKLGLDPQVQQDAQEFSKLFMSLLESSLSSQTNENVKNMIQNQFRGQYAYVTKCFKCKNESKRPSDFYELDLTLQGNKTLRDCLQDFLKEEKLEGDNQYFCGTCEKKEDAARSMRLLKLPPVLNLQLNRFIFDMQTGRKKKLNSVVQFPEHLDVSEYLREPPNTTVYHLTGVLMHVGAEANHGHYLAHIQDPLTEQWFKFSDELVEPIGGGKHPKLGREKDILESEIQNSSNVSNQQNGYGKQNHSAGRNSTKHNANSSKTSKANNNNQSSNNAYMLVYTERNFLSGLKNKPGEAAAVEKKTKRMKKCEKPSTVEVESKFPTNFPIHLKAFIEEDERLLEEEEEEAYTFKQTQIEESRALGAKMADFCENLPYHSAESIGLQEDEFEEELEFIPTDWLEKYLDNPKSASVIETKDLICIHNRLDPEQMCHVKVIDPEVADRLYEEVGCGIGRRLSRDALCLMCVRNKCRMRHLASQSMIDSKYLMDEAKKEIDSNGEAFWVGKRALKTWRTMAKNYLEERINVETNDYYEEETHFEECDSDSDDDDDDELDEEDEEDDESDELYDDEEYEHHHHLPIQNGVDKEVDCDEEEEEEVGDEEVVCLAPKRSTRSGTGHSSSDKSPKSSTKILESVQSKLSKVGTNISIVPADSSSSSPENTIPNGTPSVSEKSENRVTNGSGSKKRKLSNSTSSSNNSGGSNKSVKKSKPLKVEPVKTSPIRKNLSWDEKVKKEEVLGMEPRPKTECDSVETANGLNQLGDEKESSTENGIKLENGLEIHNQKHELNGTRVSGEDSNKKMAQTTIKSESPKKSVIRTNIPCTLSSSSTSSPKKTLRQRNGNSLTQNGNSPLKNGNSLTKNQNSQEKKFKSEEIGGEEEFVYYQDDDAYSEYEFHREILCEHDKLSPIEKNRRLVTPEVWKRLKRYFPGTRDFPRDSETCRTCEKNLEKSLQENENLKEIAAEQKSALSDIFYQRNRPTWAKSTMNKVYIISKHFVSDWRSFVQNPQAFRSPIKCLGNRSLMCEHDLLLFPLDLDSESDYDSMIYMVYESEWQNIQKFFEVDQTITVNRDKGPELLKCSPEICQECLQKMREREEQQRLCYTDVPVYVKRLTASDKIQDPSDPDFQGTPISSRGSNTTGSNHSSSSSSSNHLISQNSNSNPKHKKLKLDVSGDITQNSESSNNVHTSTPGNLNDNNKTLSTPAGISPFLLENPRRSNRRQKVRGEKSITVSSGMKLKDFKVKIMEVFKVAPFDQNLSLDGSYLTDNNKTLSELKVLPKSLIYLRADEPVANGAQVDVDDSSWAANNPEEGFKGTGLLSGF